MEKIMPSKSSLALISGAFVFLAFWGVGLATVELNAGGVSGVDAYGYGISIARPTSHSGN